MGLIATIVVFALVLGSLLLGEIGINVWMNRKFGSGTAELYRKNVPSARDRNLVSCFGFLIFCAFPHSYWNSRCYFFVTGRNSLLID